MLMDEVNPKERLFFMTLDKELEKIEEFYKSNMIKIIMLKCVLFTPIYHIYFFLAKENEASARMNLLIKQYEMLNKRKEFEQKRPERISAKDLVKQSIEFLRSNTTSSSTTDPNSEKDTPDLPNEQQKYYKPAKQHIKKAVFEFYRGVELLEKYGASNYNGFTKILKKYDKVIFFSLHKFLVLFL
jgi:hypothetical protein